jgi:hypothetical protein
MRAVFGAAVDVGVHAVGGDGQAFERFRRKTLLQRFLERRHAEHAVRAGAGDRDSDIGGIWFASPNVYEEKRDE